MWLKKNKATFFLLQYMCVINLKPEYSRETISNIKKRNNRRKNMITFFVCFVIEVQNEIKIVEDKKK